MRLIEFSKVQDFLALTQDTLELNESANNLILGICFQLRDEPECYLEAPFLAAVLDEQEQVILCAVMTPPYPLLIQGYAEPDKASNVLIEHLLKAHWRLPGVNGQKDIAEAFAHLWQVHAGYTPHLTMSQRVYEIRRVVMPPIPEGHFRRACKQDKDLLISWFVAFAKEAMGKEKSSVDVGRIIVAVDMGNAYVWERAGKLVSMAFRQRPISHSVSVSGVYTPPQERKKGYASACVAKLSQLLLDEGFAFINLFTDLANPISNDIYQKIGYKPICGFDRYSFD